MAERPTTDDVLVPEQREVQVFANIGGGVTFRHPAGGGFDDEEQMVIVPMAYLPSLIAKLRDILAQDAAEAAGVADATARASAPGAVLRVVRTPDPDGAA